MSVSKINRPGVTSVSLSKSTPRATPVPGKRRFRDGLASFGASLARGIESAASLAPGGQAGTAVYRAATAGLSATGHERDSTAGNDPTTPGATDVAGGADVGNDMMALLDKQIAMHKQNIAFTTRSNVLKSEHETKKQIVSNYR